MRPHIFTLSPSVRECQLLIDAAGHEKRLVRPEVADYIAKVNADPVSEIEKMQKLI